MATLLGSGKGPRFELTDFVLRWGRRKRQSAHDQLLIFRALASRSPKDDANGDHR